MSMGSSQQNAPKMLEQVRLSSTQRRLQEQLQTAADLFVLSIGQAAELLNVTIVQLRYWEQQGFISSVRTSDAENPGTRGQRRYTLATFKRLLVMKELLDTGYSLTDIAALQQASGSPLEELLDVSNQAGQGETASIRERVEQAEHAWLWRIFLPCILSLSANLIFETTLDRGAGLFIPVSAEPKRPINKPEDLVNLGETLVGWKGQDHPFCTFLYKQGALPDYPGQYEVISLDSLIPNGVVTNIHLLVASQLAPLVKKKANPSALKTAQRWLQIVQRHAPHWSGAIHQGGDYTVYHAPNLNNPSPLGDLLFNRLAEMVVELGGTRTKPESQEQEPRWRFSCILLPDTRLSPYHPPLVIQGQSQHSPYQINDRVGADQMNSLSQRAFQSGQIVYWRTLAEQEAFVVLKRGETEVLMKRDMEGTNGSAIALPIAGADDRSVAVLYVLSLEESDFSSDDWQLLLVMGRIIQELALTYQARHLAVEKLSQVADASNSLDEFYRSNGFVLEHELYRAIEKELAESGTRRPLALIAIDIDRYNAVAEQFGHWAERNLVEAVAQHILSRLRLTSKTPIDCTRSRINADRFFIVLPGMTLEDAKTLGRALHADLSGDYQVNAVSAGQLGKAVPLGKITVRLAVAGYTSEKLRDLLNRESQPKVENLRARTMKDLAIGLEQGKEQGGDRVLAWNMETRVFENISEPSPTASSQSQA